MRPRIGPDAATIRAWARATGKTVGSRGAIPAHLHNAYVVSQVQAQLRRAALSAGRMALSVAPQVARAAVKRSARREQ
jgi:hypothetical protein